MRPSAARCSPATTLAPATPPCWPVTSALRPASTTPSLASPPTTPARPSATGKRSCTRAATSPAQNRAPNPPENLAATLSPLPPPRSPLSPPRTLRRNPKSRTLERIPHRYRGYRCGPKARVSLAWGKPGPPASTGVPSELVRWGGSLLAGVERPRAARPSSHAASSPAKAKPPPALLQAAALSSCEFCDQATRRCVPTVGSRVRCWQHWSVRQTWRRHPPLLPVLRTPHGSGRSERRLRTAASRLHGSGTDSSARDRG